MYRPLWLNLTSDIEEMISEKNDRLLGSSGSSKTVVGGEKRGGKLNSLEMFGVFYLCLCGHIDSSSVYYRF